MKNDTDRKKQRHELEMQDDQFGSVDTLIEHLLSCGTDLTLLTLKGHLVLESFLDTILARMLRISNLPGKDKGKKSEKEDEAAWLGFYQKLKLVERFVIENYDSGPDSDLFIVVAKLNSVRNKLAHNLKSPDEIQKHVRALLDCYSAKVRKKSVRGSDLSEPLRNCLIKLWQFLFKVRCHLFEIEMERLAR